MNNIDWEAVCKIVVTGTAGVGGAAATVALTPAVLAALGFTSTGIVAGSLAAKLMAYFAVTNGGGVATGGLIATLQSWAMGGLTWAASGYLGGAGGASAGGIAWLLSSICNQTGTH